MATKSDLANIQPPINVLAWCSDAETACHYSMLNTSTGAYLKTALAIIRQQFHEIQNARNDLIDATAGNLAEAVERLRITDSYGIGWGNMLQDKDTDPQMLLDVVAVVRAYLRLGK